MSNTRQANTSSRWRAPLLFLALAVLFVLEGTLCVFNSADYARTADVGESFQQWACAHAGQSTTI